MDRTFKKKENGNSFKQEILHYLLTRLEESPCIEAFLRMYLILVAKIIQTFQMKKTKEITDGNGEVSTHSIPTQGSPTFSRTTLGAAISSEKVSVLLLRLPSQNLLTKIFQLQARIMLLSVCRATLCRCRWHLLFR